MVHSAKPAFTLSESTTGNKYLTANRDIHQGEAIFTEDVLLYGPTLDARSPMCLGCGVNVDCSTICYDCGWPVCNTYCDKLRIHKTNECEIFKKCPNMSFQRFSAKKFRLHQYDCILPLRVLFLREKSPEKWNCIEQLQHNMEIRRDTPQWENETSFVVKFIRQKCKLKQFDEELIHKVCSIIEANCFQISNSKNNLRFVYSTSNYFSHNCLPNCSFVILPSDNFKIYIRAAVDIKTGDQLTYSKIKPITPTLLRRQELLQSYYISCQCNRCCDPTELNSHFSTLKCPKCRKGEREVISFNPLDFEADWKCTKCKYQKSYKAMRTFYNEIEKEMNKVNELKSTPEMIACYEKLIKKYSSKLHPNHAFITYMKYTYLLLCLSGDTFDSSDYDEVETKIKWLEELLQVFDIVAPGFTCVRGRTLHMLYKAFVIKAKKYTNEQEKFTKCMTKALSYLDSAEQIMVVEKPFSQNGDDTSP